MHLLHVGETNRQWLSGGLKGASEHLFGGVAMKSFRETVTQALAEDVLNPDKIISAEYIFLYS